MDTRPDAAPGPEPTVAADVALGSSPSCDVPGRGAGSVPLGWSGSACEEAVRSGAGHKGGRMQGKSGQGRASRAGKRRENARAAVERGAGLLGSGFGGRSSVASSGNVPRSSPK